MRKGFVEHTFIEAGEQKIPAKIYREMRRNVRFSIVKKGAILRMPLLMPQHEQQLEIINFRHWVQKQMAAREKLQEHFTPKIYQTGDSLQVWTKTYTLRVEPTKNKTHSAKLAGKKIQLRIAEGDHELNVQKAIKHLLSRVVAQDVISEITERVHDLNRQFFQKNITSVNLKYNLTNWGSCSTKGNINLSTRLLFAPPAVIDYVIIHELAHLVEMNHSARFWALVEQAMPDFREKEVWLKKNWQICNF